VDFVEFLDDFALSTPEDAMEESPDEPDGVDMTTLFFTFTFPNPCLFLGDGQCDIGCVVSVL